MAYSLIERPEARYRVIYGMHNRITPSSELPSQFDALFLEEGRWQYGKIEIGDGFNFRESIPYSKILERAAKEEIKVYFGDVPPRELSFPPQI